MKLNGCSVGMNYKSAISKQIVENLPFLDFIEVYTEKFFINHRDPDLNTVLATLPMVLHGLDMSLGSPEPLSADYYTQLSSVLNSMEYEWFSDHICLTKIDNIEVGHLMPVQFTDETSEIIINKVKQISSLSKKPFLLENITYYYEIPGSHLTESEFISKIISEADCGLLLDVNNLYINSINHQYDPIKFLHQLPLERVVEIHLAGGAIKFDMLVDTHAHAIPAGVWEIFEYVCKHVPFSGVIIERDANFEHFDELIAEVNFARETISKYRSLPTKLCVNK